MANSFDKEAKRFKKRLETGKLDKHTCTGHMPLQPGYTGPSHAHNTEVRYILVVRPDNHCTHCAMLNPTLTDDEARDYTKQAIRDCREGETVVLAKTEFYIQK